MQMADDAIDSQNEERCQNRSFYQPFTRLKIGLGIFMAARPA